MHGKLYAKEGGLCGILPQVCSSTCSKGIRSKPCVDLGNYNWLPNYVAKRGLKIKELV